MKTAVWTVAGLITWALLTYLALHEYPTVVKSAATQECVRVISTSPYHACGNLPEKYNVTWTD